MKTPCRMLKAIYWWLPVIAMAMQVGLFNWLDFILRHEPSPPAPFGIAGDILLAVVMIFVVLIGYFVTYLYERLKYEKIVLVYAILAFFVCEVLMDYKYVIEYNYMAKDAVYKVVVGCLGSVLVWTSYPVILSGLLHWYSKKVPRVDESF